MKVHDISGGHYSDNKNVKFKAPVLRSDFCDYSDAYGAITVEGINENNRTNKELAFKNNALFRYIKN